MFDLLTDKFHNLFSKFAQNKKITEDNIQEAVRDVRLALLEADVNYSVASLFVKRVKEKALGDKVIKSVSPKQQYIKIVHDELVELMGKEEVHLDFTGERPAVIMLCGLQGSGKTTHCVKLANFIKKKHQHKKILIAACDLQRPAAIEQLKRFASEANIEVFSSDEKKPQKVAKKALNHAKDEKYDILIIDTAGRLHVDEELMDELKDIKDITKPNEILFVANATTGQDAVKTAQEFDQKVNITGSILTMLDSDARAGAAISIREVTKKPLKFEGVGEKINDIQIFNPHSMADRILGMGDVINLVKKAEDAFSEEETEKIEKKIKKATFNYDDYLKQMSMVKKMGSLKGIMKMIPGFSSMSNFDMPEGELKKIEAIIMSMTKEERQGQDLEHSRRRRLAKGSGTSIDDVNRLVKGFKQLRQMLKKFPTKGLKGAMPDMNKLRDMGGKLWR